jgi:hypothetical protein
MHRKKQTSRYKSGKKLRPKKRATTSRAHSLRSRRARRQIPKTARQYFSKSEEFQETWDSVGQVISKMRASKVSLRTAAKEFEIDPEIVIRLGKSALRKRSNGRYVPKKNDSLLRVLSVLTPDGTKQIAIRDSRQASLIGKYWSAVQKYVQTGDSSGLKKLQKTKITDASRKRFPLITDLDELSRLGSAGVLSFESLYGRSA